MQEGKNLTKKQREQLEITNLFEDGGPSERNPDSEFASLFEEAVSERDVKVGDIVHGKIVEVQTDYVLIDISYKSEGLIPMSEFRVVEGSAQIQKEIF